MYIKKLLLPFILLISTQINAEVVPYQEDPYTQQAPQELVNLAEKVANLVEYKEKFEVIAPKKAGIEINPWNKFIGYGKNPGTGNNFILINPEWFSTIEPEQQTFLLARCFTILQEGFLPKTNLQIVWILFIILSILLTILFYWILDKSSFQLKKWMRVIGAIVIVILAELLIFDKIHLYIAKYLNSRFDIQVIEKTIEKTGNKDAAIKALQHFDASIKQNIQNGLTFFEPYKDLFEKYALELANK